MEQIVLICSIFFVALNLEGVILDGVDKLVGK
jgi:hypothetical protein